MTDWILRKFLHEISEAIEARDGSACVFYITGQAGVGKTVLLRQVGRELGSQDGIAPHFPWSGILDLYHSAVNTNSGLEERLMKALETADEFSAFRTEREEFAARRAAGLLAQELEEARAHLAATFADCLNKVTSIHRVVVALDTTERIQYGADRVQVLGGLTEESTTVKPWLLDQLARWRNCVVLLAGRPDPSLASALQSRLKGVAGVTFIPRDLTGFDQDEMRRYLALRGRDVPGLDSLSEADRSLLWQVTEGRPIRVELFLESLKYGLGFDRLWQNITQGSPAKARQEIDRWLMAAIMNDQGYELHEVLQYLAVARKGLDSALLRHLTGWDEARCHKQLEELKKRTFVKIRPDDGRIFWHDEVFDLCDNYLIVRAGDLSKRIAEWYDRQIGELEGAMGRPQGDEERRETQRKLQDLRVDSLIYRLRADPHAGYEWYTRQAEYAIRAAEVGYDMRLRNELLAFVNSASEVDRKILPPSAELRRAIEYDAAAHWVKRYMIRGENEKAVALAGRVREAPEFQPLFTEPSLSLARADLGVYHAQALIYTHRADEAIELLKSVIAELEGGASPEELAGQEPKSFAGWRRNLILGRAHNNLGYAYWMVLRRYGLALQEFRRALPYFRASDLLEETANTTDNMGRVYAALYRRSQAESLVEDGLQLRRRLGRDYRVALSLISRAIVHSAFNEPHRAFAVAKQALDICEGLETKRGIGLATLVVGRAARQLGALWATGVYGYEDSKKFLAEARRAEERAIGIFKEVTEPVRLVEAYNELGCTYREWAALERDHALDSPLPRALSATAIRWLEESLRQAEELGSWVQYTDTCEDIAEVYVQQGDFDRAALWLQRAEEKIPDAYKIIEGRGLGDVPLEERVEEYWQILGKVELRRGHMAYDRADAANQGKVTRAALEEAMTHYALAATYFERYSAHAVRLEATHKQVYSRIRRCKLEDLEYIQGTFLPSLKDRYGLDPATLGRFFEETLGLALQSP
jgi:tetratricopeptide (TPR) repeat protein